jgi:predicted amino acid racemase
MALKPNKIVVDAENNEEVTIVSPSLQKKVEEIKVNEEVNIVAPSKEEVIQPIKKVKIKMKETHKCFIGGEWYHLLEGKQYNVPENVKEILAMSDLLLPL